MRLWWYRYGLYRSVRYADLLMRDCYICLVEALVGRVTVFPHRIQINFGSDMVMLWILRRSYYGSDEQPALNNIAAWNNSRHNVEV